MTKLLQTGKGFFIALVGLLFAVGAQAQTWDSPTPDGSVVTSGSSYYVYNLGKNAFLDRGGDWVTQAIAFPNKGALITVTQSSSLWTLQYDDVSHTLFPASTSDGSVYTDNSTNNTWNVLLSDATKNTYTIQVNSSYAGYNASQYLGTSSTTYSSNTGSVYDVRYNRAESDYTQWKFCTAGAVDIYNAKVKLDKFMKIAKLLGSSIDLTSYISTYNSGTAAQILTAAANLDAALAPVDKSASITNPAFNSNPSTGWTATTGYGYNYTEVEYYGKSFDINQKIIGLPAGVYVLKAQGFERPAGLSTAAQTWFNNGWDGRSAKLYATVSGTTTTEPFKSIYSESTSTVGSTINGTIYPNSMADANTAFTAGLYDNDLTYFIVDATGTATIGLAGSYRSSGNYTEGQWVLFDNFRLYYYGALPTPALAATPTSLLLSEATPSATITVGGSNLTSDIILTCSDPNVTVSPSTILAANANTGNTVTVTFNTATGTTVLNDTIVVSATGVTNQKVAVVTSKDSQCFSAHQSATNLVPDPYMLDLTKYSSSWGARSQVIDNAACGATYAKVSGQRAGSLTFPITWNPDHIYHLYAKVKTDADGYVFGLGTSYVTSGVADYEYAISNTNSAWVDVDFEFITGASAASGNVWLNNYASNLSGTADIDNWELYDMGTTSSIATKLGKPFQVLSGKGQLTIQSEDAKSVSIYSITGQLVKKVEVSGTKTIALPQGFYLVNGVKAFVK